MSEQAYRVTITLDAEDLTREGGQDRGSTATLVQREVSAEVRHLIEKDLAQMMIKWGDEKHGTG